jgi:3-methylcrotonyl-CoA carboxylase alpha subunit
MAGEPVSRIAPGMLSVIVGGRREIVYVAGSPSDRWAFWNGHVFHSSGDIPRSQRRPGAIGPLAQSLTAPMPATVISVLVAPGVRVAKGETVILLEAMKMELPIRAPGAGTVTAVHCQAGDLVRADQELIELESEV